MSNATTLNITETFESANMNTKPSELKLKYDALKEAEPSLRARDAATKLGVSEGELLASRVGDDAIRLTDDAEALLKEIVTLDEVMALTRNESCVHERKGVYDNAEFTRHGKNFHMGLFVNPDIDLRLFMSSWAFNFAAIEQTRGGPRKSLQFFDKSGQATHKIYLTPKSNEAAYDTLVSNFKTDEQTNSISVEAYPAKAADRPDEEVDWKGFRTAWENMKDTHDFYPMLQKFKAGRTQAHRHIGEDFAFQVPNSSARNVLDQAGENGCEIMVFVGNRGCIQIHSGPVKKLLEYGTWYNVMDPKFNLHLNEEQIFETWVTKKPTVDGIVTAVEVFDAQGELIVTFFGKRKPGIPELELWREIVAKIPTKEQEAA